MVCKAMKQPIFVGLQMDIIHDCCNIWERSRIDDIMQGKLSGYLFFQLKFIFSQNLSTQE